MFNFMTFEREEGMIVLLQECQDCLSCSHNECVSLGHKCPFCSCAPTDSHGYAFEMALCEQSGK